MMTATYSEKEVQVFPREEFMEYKSKFIDLTKEERISLREWVRDGNSVYSNPYLYSDDGGWPMDYIRAIRVNEEMIAHPERIEFPNTAEYEALVDDRDDEPF